MSRTTYNAAIIDPLRAQGMRTAREQAGLSQQDAADRLEVSRGTLRRWERGFWMSAASIRAASQLYGVTEEAIRGANEAPGVSTASAPSRPATARTIPREALIAWAKFTVDALERGATEEDLAFLRGFVLAPEIFKPNISEADIAEHVTAGLVAAHAWIAHRYGER